MTPPAERHQMFGRPVRLRNETCAYCGIDLSDRTTDEDHLIARRLVPNGRLQKSWNLIVRTCVICNNTKSKLEDDISSISMQATAAGEFATADPDLRKEATRKGKSSSWRTGRPVRDSYEPVSFEAPLGHFGGMAVSGLSQPQPDEDRLFEFARLQVVALVYWLTYRAESRQGRFWSGGFFPLTWSFRADWGNALHRSFMREIADWKTHLLLTGAAEGYFKAALRRQPGDASWSWALEWNHNVRAIGFFGDQASAEEVAGRLSNPPSPVIIPQPDGSLIHFREERAIQPEEDTLFATSRTDDPWNPAEA